MAERLHSITLTLVIDTNKRTTTYAWEPGDLDGLAAAMREAAAEVGVRDLGDPGRADALRALSATWWTSPNTREAVEDRWPGLAHAIDRVLRFSSDDGAGT